MFCPCVGQKVTTHLGKNTLNMRQQAQKDFCDVVIRISQHQKWYIVNLPHKWNIVSLYGVVFDDSCLLCWRTRYKPMQKLWLYNELCHT